MTNIADSVLSFSSFILCIDHRNIKTQGTTTAETSIIKLDGFYWFH